MILLAHFLDHAANHELGGVEVGNHAVAQWPDGLDALVHFSTHLTCGFTHSHEFLSLGVESHHRWFVYHYLIVVDNNSVGCS